MQYAVPSTTGASGNGLGHIASAHGSRTDARALLTHLAPPWEVVIPIPCSDVEGGRVEKGEAHLSPTGDGEAPHNLLDVGGVGTLPVRSLLGTAPSPFLHTAGGVGPTAAPFGVDASAAARRHNTAVRSAQYHLIMRERRRTPEQHQAQIIASTVVGVKRPRTDLLSGVEPPLHSHAQGGTASSSPSASFYNGDISPDAEVDVWLVRTGPMLLPRVPLMAPNNNTINTTDLNSHRVGSTCNGAPGTHCGDVLSPSNFLGQRQGGSVNAHGAASAAVAPALPFDVLPYGELVLHWHCVSTMAALCPRGLGFKGFAKLFYELIVGGGGSVGGGPSPCSSASEVIAADVSRFAKSTSGGTTNTAASSSSPSADAVVLLSALLHTHGTGVVSAGISQPLQRPAGGGEGSFQGAHGNTPTHSGTAANGAASLGLPPSSFMANYPHHHAGVGVGGRGNSLLDTQLHHHHHHNHYNHHAAHVPQLLLNATHTASSNGNGNAVDTCIGGSASSGRGTVHVQWNGAAQNVDALLGNADRALAVMRRPRYALRRTCEGEGDEWDGAGGHAAAASSNGSGHNGAYKVLLTPTADGITSKLLGTAGDTAAGGGASASLPPSSSPSSVGLMLPPSMIRVDVCLTSEEGFGHQLNFATFHLRLVESTDAASSPTHYPYGAAPASCLGGLPPPPPPPPFASGGGDAISSALCPPLSASSEAPMSAYLSHMARVMPHHQQWAALVPSLVGAQSLLCSELTAATLATARKEDELLSAFVVLINEKKRKIKELLGTATAQQDVIGALQQQVRQQEQTIGQLMEERERHQRTSVVPPPQHHSFYPPSPGRHGPTDGVALVDVTPREEGLLLTPQHAHSSATPSHRGAGTAPQQQHRPRSLHAAGHVGPPSDSHTSAPPPPPPTFVTPSFVASATPFGGGGTLGVPHAAPSSVGAGISSRGANRSLNVPVPFPPPHASAATPEHQQASAAHHSNSTSVVHQSHQNSAFSNFFGPFVTGGDASATDDEGGGEGGDDKGGGPPSAVVDAYGGFVLE